jgi:hypothetical protein
MAIFVSPDTYEQKLHMLQDETLVIKDLAQIILLYDCVCLKPGSEINCTDKYNKIYYSTVLCMNNNAAIVYYHGWRVKHIEEVPFDKISLKNREEIIQSHFYLISRGRSEEECLSTIIALETEGYQLNRIISKMPATIAIKTIRQRVIRAASLIFEE